MSSSVIWLGHASFRINFDDKVIYIDPYEGEYKDKADLVLISHSHHDHCDPSSIEKIRKEDTLVVAPSDCAIRIGGNVSSIRPGEKVTMSNITVEAVDSYNYKRFRSPGIPFHPKGLGVGYLISIGDKKIYHAGDTDFIPEMKKLDDVYLALLPSGGTYTMDNDEAIEAALAINPEYAFPMHRWDTDPSQFKDEIESKSEIKVILLKPGERFDIE